MTINKFAIARTNAITNAHRAALRPVLIDRPEVRAVLKMFPAKVRKEVYFSLSDYSDTVNFYLSLRDLDSLKDKRLARCLEAFATDATWESASADYTYDTPNRDFTFRKTLTLPLPPKSTHTKWLVKNGHSDTMRAVITVMISAYVKADSDSCRIEVVDRVEKVVIEEVKRIVCA